MFVFLDFEASSLARHSYPIEVAWVFEDGTEESHLIRPAPAWDDWDISAEAIHHIDRTRLLTDGTPHDLVAQRMVDRLNGHDLFASAPSWDGKWLSTLLRAAGLPRHTLRLRDTDDAQRDIAVGMLRHRIAQPVLASLVDRLRQQALAPLASAVPTHRALPDARLEQARWAAVRAAAQQFSA